MRHSAKLSNILVNLKCKQIWKTVCEKCILLLESVYYIRVFCAKKTHRIKKSVFHSQFQFFLIFVFLFLFFFLKSILVFAQFVCFGTCYQGVIRGLLTNHSLGTISCRNQSQWLPNSQKYLLTLGAASFFFFFFFYGGGVYTPPLWATSFVALEILMPANETLVHWTKISYRHFKIKVSFPRYL